MKEEKKLESIIFGLKAENAELQKQVDELKEKIINLKTAMISRVAMKSYDSMLTTPDDVEEIFGDAYESEFNKFLGQAEKDTAKEILEELDLFFKGTTFRQGYEFKKIEEKLKEIAERKGVKLE